MNENGTIHQRFSVSFDYPVYFTEGVFCSDNPVLAEALTRKEPDGLHRLLVVIDEGVAAATPTLVEQIGAYTQARSDQIELAGDPEMVIGGEKAKASPRVFDQVLQRIHDSRIDRKSSVVIIGGGAVQDAAGYAAAIAHRGVRVVRIPTTVESQCDSGVGVKNAVNAFDTKNFVGSFAPPFAVINDRAFLATLDRRDVRAGMAEAVKVALLRDAAFFDWIWRKAEDLAGGDPQAVGQLIRRAAELHLDHIAGSGDPFELGRSKPLDYGHWAAHKLETLSRFELRHGEAVAIGLVIDGRFAVERGLLSEEVVARMCVLLERLGFVLWNPALALRTEQGVRTVIAGLEEFREHLGGALTLTMLTDVGLPVDVNEVDPALMERAIAWLEFRSRTK
jgi:3-dehydroquinate synthase